MIKFCVRNNIILKRSGVYQRSAMATITILTPQDHMRNRPMWIGAHGESRSDIIVVKDNQMVKCKDMMVSETLFKTVEELLTNAVDGLYRDRTHNITRIEGKLNCAKGWFSISDDGDGMPVYEVPATEDHKAIWSVEALITNIFSGTSFGDINGGKDEWRVTGGVNGVGLKAVASNSAKLTVTTIDRARGMFYEQSFERGKVIAPPVVRKAEPNEKGTTVYCVPDQKVMCGRDDWLSDPTNAATFRYHFNMLFRTSSAFVDFAEYRFVKEEKIIYDPKKKPKFILNNKEIAMKPQDFSALTCTVMPVVVKFHRSIHMTVSITHRENNIDDIHVVNGVRVRLGGKHIDIIIDMIVAALFTKSAEYLKSTFGCDIDQKKFRKIIQKKFHITSFIQMPVPKFQSQTKDKITLLPDLEDRMKNALSFNSNDIRKLFDLVEAKLCDYAAKSVKIDKKKVNLDKYVPARVKGKYLFVPEGDTAASLVDDILNLSKKYTRNNSGYLTTRGVPMNVMKQTKSVGSKHYPNKKLLNNEFFAGLLTVLNISIDNDYYYGSDPVKRAAGDKEYAALKYGQLILATDQDIDGMGHICSLVLVIFCLYWPNLVRRGFVARLSTPVMRVYHKTNNDCKRFYTEAEYNEWRVLLSPAELAKWKNPEYYKGLGGHSDSQKEQCIVKNLDSTILRFVYDDMAATNCIIFYGNITTDRKAVLVDPDAFRKIQKPVAPDEKGTVSCTNHFIQHSADFQMETILRKLPNMDDGLIPSYRKIFAAVRKRAPGFVKVFQLGGYVADVMGYHHGDASMNQAIINMSQTFWGSNFVPLLLPHGYNGNIKKGRKQGQPRYLAVKYNSVIGDILFPRECDMLLDYVIVEGEVAEPKRYVPIFPYHLVTTNTAPAAGFKIGSYARDHKFVYDVLVDRLEGRITKFPSLLGHPWIPDGCTITVQNGSEICRASFMVEGDTVYISDMPPKMWTTKYIKTLVGYTKKDKTWKEGLEHVISVDDDSSNRDGWDIKIHMNPGAITEINHTVSAKYGLTPLETYLKLYMIMRPCISMTDDDGRIRVFKTYEESMEVWYNSCRTMYDRRIAREILICDTKIRSLENVLRYVELDSGAKKLPIDGLKQAEREKLLEQHKFDRMKSISGIRGKTNAEIAAIISEGDYKYLMSITVGMKSEESIAALRAKIDKIKKQRADHASDGAATRLWLQEVRKYMDTYNSERAARWNVEDKENTKYE
jgi:DNA topoisomerase-2